MKFYEDGLEFPELDDKDYEKRSTTSTTRKLQDRIGVVRSLHTIIQATNVDNFNYLKKFIEKNPDFLYEILEELAMLDCSLATQLALEPFYDAVDKDDYHKARDIYDNIVSKFGRNCANFPDISAANTTLELEFDVWGVDKQ